MNNQEAVNNFRSIAIHANQMADHIEDFISGRIDKIDDLYLTKLMGELHNRQQNVEGWLFKILTTPKENV
jgi:hypothetical protein